MQLNSKLNIIGALLSVIFLFSGCENTWDEHYKTLDVITQKNKVLEELEKIPEISKFTEAVKQNDTLVDLLSQNRLFTVLAPVNETFEQIDPSIINDKTLFSRLVLHHFVDGKYKYKDFSSADLRTFTNKSLRIDQDWKKEIIIDKTSTIVQRDFLSQNGMIQVIDTPIIPVDNMYEHFIYNQYTDLFSVAIDGYTIREFNQAASTPVGRNSDNKVIYDTVFNVSNPFLLVKNLDRPIDFYGTRLFYFMDITDETEQFTFVFPQNYETSLNTVKSSSFLNNSIADYNWAGPILANFVYDHRMYRDARTVKDIIRQIELYHSDDDREPREIWLYFAELLANNLVESFPLSNGTIHLVDGFEYDPAWLIKEQGGLEFNEKEDDYKKDVMGDMSLSENADTALIYLGNIKITFHNDSTQSYLTKIGESANFEITGNFYPVDYDIMVRGKNTASGTFNVEADGKEIGDYNFNTAPSGDNDITFDKIGTVSFTETKTTTNVKFTFKQTHTGANKYEQHLWIREIKFSPVLN